MRERGREGREIEREEERDGGREREGEGGEGDREGGREGDRGPTFVLEDLNLAEVNSGDITINNVLKCIFEMGHGSFTV